MGCPTASGTYPSGAPAWRACSFPWSRCWWRSCDIGLTPVIDPENKALTRSQLSHIDQNYLRADTIAAANAALISAESRIELAQI
ncbi:Tn3 family transposase [Streptomyces niveus]|uniref:Tn3 family transposase n=1 Tax=Streptomyces niveus TaxID=193462 RepID=UPI0033EC9162